MASCGYEAMDLGMLVALNESIKIMTTTNRREKLVVNFVSDSTKYLQNENVIHWRTAALKAYTDRNHCPA